MKKGKVFLVGAGPGDARLITVKGLDAINQAEVILYDRLANPKLLDFAPVGCEFIYCGKLPDRHILRQENINELLAAKALEGKTVVRLKGGDPGVFGRVGEEAEVLARYQIPFEIVPGITSGIAAPLYAGIPVTHREYAESFAVVTAHDKSKEGKPVLDWEGLARGVDTIAFYMGVGNLPFICENMIRYGKSPATPVILIQWGTFSRQKTLEGTLGDIAGKALEKKFSNPAIILVGNVVSLRKKISWFEKKPLYGRQILLARTGGDISEVANELMEQGADVIEFPKWKRTDAPFDPEKIFHYDHVLFSSPESVDEVFKAIIEKQIDIRQIKAAFYGRSHKTMKRLNERGLLAGLKEESGLPEKTLIVGDNTILQNNEAHADLLVTSRKEIDRNFLPIFKRMLGEAQADTVIFPSSASVEALVRGLQECGMEAREALKGMQIICMGEKTRNAVLKAGLEPVGMPEKASVQALVDYLAGLE